MGLVAYWLIAKGKAFKTPRSAKDFDSSLPNDNNSE